MKRTSFIPTVRQKGKLSLSSVQQDLGNRNMQSLMSSPRLQSTLDKSLPAASAHRQAQATTAQHAVNTDYTGSRSFTPSLQTQMGLASIPKIQGGGLHSLGVAFRGASGTTPFVSDGPLSENRGAIMRGTDLQQRIDATKQHFGMNTPNPGSQNQFTPTLPRGTQLRAKPDGGIRLVGPEAVRISDDTINQRRRMLSGVPTTRNEDGEVVPAGGGNEQSLALRSRRQKEARQFQDSLRASAKKGQGGQRGKSATVSFDDFPPRDPNGPRPPSDNPTQDMMDDLEQMAFKARKETGSAVSAVEEAIKRGYLGVMRDLYEDLSGGEMSWSRQEEEVFGILSEYFESEQGGEPEGGGSQAITVPVGGASQGPATASLTPLGKTAWHYLNPFRVNPVTGQPWERRKFVPRSR